MNKKISCMAVTLFMLSVSFVMCANVPAKAGYDNFVEPLTVPWTTDFVPKDMAWNQEGDIAMVVGEAVSGPNSWAYYPGSGTWNSIANPWTYQQNLSSVCWDNLDGRFWIAGQPFGAEPTSVYFWDPDSGLNMEYSVELAWFATCISVDQWGNPLVFGFESFAYYLDVWNGAVSWTLIDHFTPFGSVRIFGVDYNWNNHQFYAVGENFMAKGFGGFNAILLYTDSATAGPLSASNYIYASTETIHFEQEYYNSIAWNQAGNYGVAVGTTIVKINPDTTGEVWVAETFQESFRTVYYDISWDQDGYGEAAVVGLMGTFGDPSYLSAYYWRLIPNNWFISPDPCDLQYAETPWCVGFKPPSSPSYPVIPYSGGGIIIHTEAIDESTRITANAVFPKLHWIGFNDTLLASKMDQQVIVDADYVFTLQANYSEGWDNCQAEVWAWYDNGLTGLAGSAYPGTPDATTRNLAFRITYFAVNDTAWVWYPITALEVTVGAPQDIDWFAPNADPTQNHHRVLIPVWFGNQIRSATYGGVAPVGPDYSPDPDIALNNVNSWDFNVTVRDRLNPTALTTHYGEFGIESAVSISVTGNPSGNAPPGTTDNPMTAPSRIVYSSNAEYFVNVSIPNLYMNGVIGAPDFIPAIDVSIQNTHVDVNAGNSDFSVQTHITGANTNMYVWGAPLDVGIPPANNGLVSAGPIMTDYTTPLAAWTDLNWWVDVAPGTAEGIYWGVITISIEN
ncbi:MAG: hypothetical protein PHU53_06155 [Thermoplasmata archaeon]|nr:hypothetical protein [Thermoplasmata archaeon]